MGEPVPVASPPAGAAARTAIAVVPLLVVWALAFTGTTPLYPTLAVGAALMVGLTWWVWSAGFSAPVRGFPSLSLTPRLAWFALVVAVIHYLVGAALFALAERFVPAFAATAATTYDRASAAPLWMAVLLGGLLSAPAEEVFWRGAVQPVVTGWLADRWPGAPGGPYLPIVVVALGYGLFHAATLQLALVAAAVLGGLVWGWLLHRTGSLAATMLAHATWTTLMLLVPPSAA